MGRLGKSGATNGSKDGASLYQDHVRSLHNQIESYEREKIILLDLSNEITKIRNKDDLIETLSSRLKRFFSFRHAAVSLVDRKNGTYFPFLLDVKSHPNKDDAHFDAMIHRHNSMHDPFFRRLLDLKVPVSFLLEEIITEDGVPLFVKSHYEAGIRRVLVIPLTNRMELLGFIYVSSDDTDTFSADFVGALNGISPLLANAVANIIINEEVADKERINETLLALSNDLVMARDRMSLLNALRSRLRKLIYFGHVAVTELDETGKFYHAFLVDPDSRAKNQPAYDEMLGIENPVDDGICNVASRSTEPVIIRISSINLHDAPLWMRLNRSVGVQEIIMKSLPGQGISKYSILLLSDRLNAFDEKAVEILERISSQLATAISNIAANDEILAKDKDKTFLLEFSHEVASARTREDLSAAIHTALKKLSDVKVYFIRTINEDGSTMSPFLFDKEVSLAGSPAFSELLATEIPVNAGLSAKMLKARGPLFVDFAEEMRQGYFDYYIEFWKSLGPQKSAFQKMYGTALRTGNTNLGILWVVTPKINTSLLEGICAQISVALSNIRSNEEIRIREEEKSILLSISDEIASLRSRNDLSEVLNTKIKKLLSVTDFGIAQIDDDQLTYSQFVLALGEEIKSRPDFGDIVSRKYSVKDPVFSRVVASNDPLVLDVETLADSADVPAYVHFWKGVGVRKVIAAALRVGGKDIGCAFLHAEPSKNALAKTNLVKAVCAQVSVAVSNILANEQLLNYKQYLEVENDHLKEQIKNIYNFADIIGSGAEMQKVYRMMSLVAWANATVLLLGETGTGKELIARAIHNASVRKNKLMVKVNCAALPANLIESELFGHEKGSFTGAVDRRIGKFELANNSSIFLDEIGEMPLEMQVKLLRAIQEREIERVGGKAPIKVDVRIIAATNRNLDEEVKAGRFRSDLYYRLNVFPITLPPLRSRQEDIVPLANFFLARYAKTSGRKVTSISSRVAQELRNYSWPGNVRELEHLIERSVLFSDGSVLREVQLPNTPAKQEGASLPASTTTLQQAERTFIVETIKKCGGKISGKGGAADLLEIPATTLHSKMKRLGISKSDYFPKPA